MRGAETSRRLGALAIGMALAVGVIALAAVFLGHADRLSGAAGAPGASATPTCDRCLPPQVSPTTLESEEVFEYAGWRLEPPRSDTEPPVPADQAVQTAWDKGAVPNADSVQAVYALLPAGAAIKSDTPVWLVNFGGVCIVPRGTAADIASPGPRPCAANSEWHVLVDAKSGEFIAAFTD